MPKAELIEVEGHNGEWFTLSGRRRADRQVDMATEPTGLFDTPVKTIYNSHAFQVGSTYMGKRFLPRDVVFGVNVYGESRNGKMSWERADSEWRKAWSYDKVTKLWTEDDSGSRRFLNLRLGEEPRFEPTKSPRLRDYGLIIMTTVASDPFWYEEDYTDEFVTTTDTTGGGYEYGSVTVENPCDIIVWPQWVLQGYQGVEWSLADYSFGNDMFERADVDADRMISTPPLMNGEHVYVNTDPQALGGQVNSSLDTQIWARMNGVQFLYPIPEYQPKIELPIRVTGAPVGLKCQLRMKRPWSRPWGLQ